MNSFSLYMLFLRKFTSERMSLHLQTHLKSCWKTLWEPKTSFQKQLKLSLTFLQTIILSKLEFSRRSKSEMVVCILHFNSPFKTNAWAIIRTLFEFFISKIASTQKKNKKENIPNKSHCFWFPMKKIVVCNDMFSKFYSRNGVLISQQQKKLLYLASSHQRWFKTVPEQKTTKESQCLVSRKTVYKATRL